MVIVGGDGGKWSKRVLREKGKLEGGEMKGLVGRRKSDMIGLCGRKEEFAA